MSTQRSTSPIKDGGTRPASPYRTAGSKPSSTTKSSDIRPGLPSKVVVSTRSAPMKTTGTASPTKPAWNSNVTSPSKPAWNSGVKFGTGGTARTTASSRPSSPVKLPERAKSQAASRAASPSKPTSRPITAFESRPAIEKPDAVSRGSFLPRTLSPIKESVTSKSPMSKALEKSVPEATRGKTESTSSSIRGGASSRSTAQVSSASAHSSEDLDDTLATVIKATGRGSGRVVQEQLPVRRDARDLFVHPPKEAQKSLKPSILISGEGLGLSPPKVQQAVFDGEGLNVRKVRKQPYVPPAEGGRATPALTAAPVLIPYYGMPSLSDGHASRSVTESSGTSTNFSTNSSQNRSTVLNNFRQQHSNAHQNTTMAKKKKAQQMSGEGLMMQKPEESVKDSTGGSSSRPTFDLKRPDTSTTSKLKRNPCNAPGLQEDAKSQGFRHGATVYIGGESLSDKLEDARKSSDSSRGSSYSVTKTADHVTVRTRKKDTGSDGNETNLMQPPNRNTEQALTLQAAKLALAQAGWQPLGLHYIESSATSSHVTHRVVSALKESVSSALKENLSMSDQARLNAAIITELLAVAALDDRDPDDRNAEIDYLVKLQYEYLERLHEPATKKDVVPYKKQTSPTSRQPVDPNADWDEDEEEKESFPASKQHSADKDPSSLSPYRSKLAKDLPDDAQPIRFGLDMISDSKTQLHKLQEAARTSKPSPARLQHRARVAEGGPPYGHVLDAPLAKGNSVLSSRRDGSPPANPTRHLQRETSKNPQQTTDQKRIKAEQKFVHWRSDSDSEVIETSSSATMPSDRFGSPLPRRKLGQQPIPSTQASQSIQSTSSVTDSDFSQGAAGTPSVTNSEASHDATPTQKTKTPKASKKSMPKDIFEVDLALPEQEIVKGFKRLGYGQEQINSLLMVSRTMKRVAAAGGNATYHSSSKSDKKLDIDETTPRKKMSSSKHNDMVQVEDCTVAPPKRFEKSDCDIDMGDWSPIHEPVSKKTEDVNEKKQVEPSMNSGSGRASSDPERIEVYDALYGTLQATISCKTGKLNWTPIAVLFETARQRLLRTAESAGNAAEDSTTSNSDINTSGTAGTTAAMSSLEVFESGLKVGDPGYNPEVAAIINEQTCYRKQVVTQMKRRIHKRADYIAKYFKEKKLEELGYGRGLTSHEIEQCVSRAREAARYEFAKNIDQDVEGPFHLPSSNMAEAPSTAPTAARTTARTTASTAGPTAGPTTAQIPPTAPIMVMRGMRKGDPGYNRNIAAIVTQQANAHRSAENLRNRRILQCGDEIAKLFVAEKQKELGADRIMTPLEVEECHIRAMETAQREFAQGGNANAGVQNAAPIYGMGQGSGPAMGPSTAPTSASTTGPTMAPPTTVPNSAPFMAPTMQPGIYPDMAPNNGVFGYQMAALTRGIASHLYGVVSTLDTVASQFMQQQQMQPTGQYPYPYSAAPQQQWYDPVKGGQQPSFNAGAPVQVPTPLATGSSLKPDVPPFVPGGAPVAARQYTPGFVTELESGSSGTADNSKNSLKNTGTSDAAPSINTSKPDESQASAPTPSRASSMASIDIVVDSAAKSRGESGKVSSVGMGRAPVEQPRVIQPTAPAANPGNPMHGLASSQEPSNATSYGSAGLAGSMWAEPNIVTQSASTQGPNLDPSFGSAGPSGRMFANGTPAPGYGPPHGQAYGNAYASSNDGMYGNPGMGAQAGAIYGYSSHPGLGFSKVGPLPSAPPVYSKPGSQMPVGGGFGMGTPQPPGGFGLHHQGSRQFQQAFRTSVTNTRDEQNRLAKLERKRLNQERHQRECAEALARKQERAEASRNKKEDELRRHERNLQDIEEQHYAAMERRRHDFEQSSRYFNETYGPSGFFGRPLPRFDPNRNFSDRSSNGGPYNNVWPNPDSAKEPGPGPNSS